MNEYKVTALDHLGVTVRFVKALSYADVVTHIELTGAIVVKCHKVNYAFH